MRYAIIQSGGKQYKAVEGETLEVDRLDVEAGKKVDLGEVLMAVDGNTILVGKPMVADATVAATVVAEEKGDKITVFKYKPKIRYRVKTGHRQKFTRLMIDSIDVKGWAKSERPVKQEAPAAEAKPVKAKKTAAKPKAAAKKVPAKKAAVKKTAVKKKK
jgi:large subunit ribosomal protein L21